MRRKFGCFTLAVVSGLLGVWTPVSAHHGGGVDWRNELVGPMTGVATEFAFRFPHVVIYMEVVDEHGQRQRWAMNTRWTPTILRQHGWTRNSVRPDDTLTVTFNPHISEPTVGNMVSLVVNDVELPLDF